MYIQAVEEADLITVNIGSNDILGNPLGQAMREMYNTDGVDKAILDAIKAELQKTGASVSGTLNAFRVIFFLLTFFTIGMVSNFRKLMEEGIGRLAIVYVVCLFGFIIWLGLFISWLFFHGMTPPLAS